MKIRTVIIDDEDDARFILKERIKSLNTNSIEIVGEADNVQSALRLLKAVPVDLIFLDIMMPDGSGFDVLEQTEVNAAIVFLTAYDEYAINAFKFSAFDYLLKPLKTSTLQETIDRYIQRNQKANSTIDNRKKVLLQHLDKNQKQMVVGDINGFEVVALDNVLSLESENQYTTIYLKDDKTILSSKSLSHFTSYLQSHQFFRMHNRHLVNLKHIVKYKKGNGGSVVLSSGAEIPLSRSNKAEFLNIFKRLMT